MGEGTRERRRKRERERADSCLSLLSLTVTAGARDSATSRRFASGTSREEGTVPTRGAGSLEGVDKGTVVLCVTLSSATRFGIRVTGSDRMGFVDGLGGKIAEVDLVAWWSGLWWNTGQLDLDARERENKQHESGE